MVGARSQAVKVRTIYCDYRISRLTLLLNLCLCSVPDRSALGKTGTTERNRDLPSSGRATAIGYRSKSTRLAAALSAHLFSPQSARPQSASPQSEGISMRFHDDPQSCIRSASAPPPPRLGADPARDGAPPRDAASDLSPHRDRRSPHPLCRSRRDLRDLPLRAGRTTAGQPARRGLLSCCNRIAGSGAGVISSLKQSR